MNKLQAIHHKAKTDLYFFDKEILGFSKMRPLPHKELCSVVQDKAKRKKLILMPRGSFKSSVVTVGYSLFQLTEDPNKRILISHELQKNAKKYVKEIKGHIEGNPKFRAIFGDWVNKSNTWRDDEFIIKPRTKVLKEPSIMAGSLEKGVTVGLHFDTIILDDPVSRSNTRTRDQIEKTIEYYKLILSVLEPGGTMIVIGTRWHQDDLYGFLSDPVNGEAKNFDVFIKKAVDKQGKYLMPDVLSPDFLQEVRESQGEEIFHHQYLNDPVIKSHQTFNEEDIKFFDKSPTGLYYFITIDSAIALNKYADYTAIIVNGVDYNHNYYIQEAIQGRMKPNETLDLFFKLAQKYSPVMCVGFETNALDQALRSMIEEEMGRRELFYPIADVKIDTRIKKEDRIRWLQLKFVNNRPRTSDRRQGGGIFIKKEHEELYEQLIRHPQCKHDDLLDALKSQLKITFPSNNRPLENDPLAKFSPKERSIWEDVQNLGKRKIKRKSKWTRI